MKKSDKQLGMDRKITRRNFINGIGIASLGVSFPEFALANELSQTEGSSSLSNHYYPPTQTGLRGSHPGAFESAHRLAREGKGFTQGKSTGEEYDLVVVGGGISGLASAYYYRKKNPAARILILDNHDDFGGHAKRNEFHQGGEMRLSWGGTMNLEYPSFSQEVNNLMTELGVDIDKLLASNDFKYGYDGKAGPAIYFDKQSYGKDVLSIPCNFRDFGLKELAKQTDKFPLSEESRNSMKKFALTKKDIRTGMTSTEINNLMHKTSYIDFLLKYGKLTPEAAQLFVKTTDGYWGVSAHSLSVAECIGAGLPIKHLLGETHEPSDDPVGGAVAMFPDGNASIARLLVRKLIPEVAPGDDMDDIVSAKFDYSKLDQSTSKIKLRLNSTVIKVDDKSINGDVKEAVTVSYICDEKVQTVKAKQVVMACYHAIIPHLCQQMPEAQKKAASYQVKRPLIVTNVLLRNSKAADKLGISGAYCPGRMHGATWLVKGVNSADYKHPWSDDGPVAMMFWGSVAASNSKLTIKEQHRDSRMNMLALTFEDYEREVRTVLDGMLGPAGFNVKTDILAITVNRWPHGYAYDYLDLWDPKWPVGEAPHEIARKRFGNIAIANSDAGAQATSQVAIDEAWRAVNELHE